MSHSPLFNQSWQQLLGAVADSWPAERWRDLGVVVGCSGGADSIALVHALAQLRELDPLWGLDPSRRQAASEPLDSPRGFLVVAHFNHLLRGAESDADQQTAEQAAFRLGLRWVSGAAESTRRDEASLREARTRFLIDTAHATGARYLAIAHSADDNVETVLHHLFRGTGPSGLTGIGTPRSIADDLVLIRPLLAVRRDLIRQALVEKGIKWREDASNLDRSYRRNWIRHELIPMIETHYPHAIDAVGRAIEGQRQWRGLVDELADRWLQQHQISETPLMLRCEPNSETAVVIAAVQRSWSRLHWPRQEMTREHWTRLAETIASGAAQRYTLPSGVDVSSDGQVIKFSRQSVR